MKKLTSLLLAVMLLLTAALPVQAALPETAVPYYANTSQASVSFVIEEDGSASWTIMCTCKSSATGIYAVTYLERQVGNNWVRVDLDVPNDQYTYSTTSKIFAQNNKHTFTEAGTYRAVVVFTVYGTTENETLTFWNTHNFAG